MMSVAIVVILALLIIGVLFILGGVVKPHSARLAREQARIDARNRVSPSRQEPASGKKTGRITGYVEEKLGGWKYPVGYLMIAFFLWAAVHWGSVAAEHPPTMMDIGLKAWRYWYWIICVGGPAAGIAGMIRLMYKSLDEEMKRVQWGIVIAALIAFLLPVVAYLAPSGAPQTAVSPPEVASARAAPKAATSGSASPETASAGVTSTGAMQGGTPEVASASTAPVVSRHVAASKTCIPGPSWPTMDIGPGGNSPLVEPPIGKYLVVCGHGYRIHAKYQDGSDCTVGGTKPCPDGALAGVYVENTKKVRNVLAYAFALMRER